MKNSIELFREENIPLSVQCTKSTEYQKIVRFAMTVEFQGEEYTLPQMRRFLESNDREVRRELGFWSGKGGCRIHKGSLDT